MPGRIIALRVKAGIDATELHKRAKAEGWQPQRIINLKIQAEAIGLME